MKLDEARKKTDQKLSEMESQLKDIYSEASDDVTQKWNQYMFDQNAYVKDLQDAYWSAKRAGFAAEAKEIGKQLGVAKAERTLRNEKYKETVDQTTERLAHVNEVALAYINDQLPEIYAINYNQAAKTADQVGVSFSLVNESVVKRMVKDGDIELPKKRMNIPADKRWNTKQLNSSVLQGILQGESMDKIADRIYPIVGRNESAAIRNARTMVTGAENRGRLDSYKQLEEDGLVLKKVWMATPDGRTRDWHIDMDGQEVNLDENFVDGLGNELEYPGDPGGAPETVYNCRCTMVTDVVGFKRSDGSVNAIDYEPEGETLHERQMKQEQLNRIVDNTLQAAQKAEPHITNDLQEAINAGNGSLEGLNHKFKGSDSLRRKVVDKSVKKNMTQEEYAQRITDALRYTSVSDPNSLTNDFFMTRRSLESKGYEMIEINNSFWDTNAEYRGINTLIKDPGGYAFELQFHTRESLQIKKVNHKLYEEQRLATTSEEEKIRLGNEMIKNARSIETPIGVKNIDNKILESAVKQW